MKGEGRPRVYYIVNDRDGREGLVKDKDEEGELRDHTLIMSLSSLTYIQARRPCAAAKHGSTAMFDIL